MLIFNILFPSFPQYVIVEEHTMNSVIFLMGFPLCIKSQIILPVVPPIWMIAQHNMTLKYSNKKSNPNIQY